MANEQSKIQPPFLPVMIGTGLGSGFFPWGPGTAGAILATAIWYVLWMYLSPFTLVVVTAALILIFTLLGTWATSKLTPYWGDDPHRVVVDEMVGVWIPLLLATSGLTALLSLLLFRFFDILKPLGIRAIDRKKGAFWVMFDDIIAGIYSAIVLFVIVQAYSLLK